MSQLPQATPVTPSTPDRSTTTSAYRNAIEQTTRVIERRAKSFRNLIVAVVIVGLGSVVWGIVARPSLGVAGLLLLLPACGVFFYVDAILVRDWRSAILTRWVERELDLSAFRDAIRANPSLPSNTTAAMLATLPRTDSLVAERAIASPTRQAVDAESRFAHGKREDTLGLNVVSVTVAVSAAIAALWARTWAPLLGLTALGLPPLMGLWVHRRHRAARDAQLANCRREPAFDEAEYQRLLTALGG
ncbi:MAG TPA: hypothetical protein VM076_23065 [Gemmatimonadaceae bacterium]|nr:hypothetical protein [Gemmatimonadaceae bacterium]